MLIRLLQCLEFLIYKVFFYKSILEHLSKVPIACGRRSSEKFHDKVCERFPQINYRPTNNELTQQKGENFYRKLFPSVLPKLSKNILIRKPIKWTHFLNWRHNAWKSLYVPFRPIINQRTRRASETYSKPRQTVKMEHFGKHSVLDVWIDASGLS